MDRWQKHQSNRLTQDASQLMSLRSAKIIVRVANRQKDLALSSPAVRALVRLVLDQENVSCKELSIYFVSEQKICALHKKFFNDDTPTDCITFPIDRATFGEIFVCPMTAIRYAAKNQGDPYDEIALYIIHGILHLLGFNDLQPGDRRIMRKKEKTCMAYSNELIKYLRPR
jgi:probable rRNA maturation factor